MSMSGSSARKGRSTQSQRPGGRHAAGGWSKAGQGVRQAVGLAGGRASNQPTHVVSQWRQCGVSVPRLALPCCLSMRSMHGCHVLACLADIGLLLLLPHQLAHGAGRPVTPHLTQCITQQAGLPAPSLLLTHVTGHSESNGQQPDPAARAVWRPQIPPLMVSHAGTREWADCCGEVPWVQATWLEVQQAHLPACLLHRPHCPGRAIYH
ncbi:hypothetical protein HaLaN_08311 [Haematococcus lacustris]|uniref:Uncharacterized protein n=1 Tax=Haematococcus lacustris TaxID=44745 RepID=A0A699YYT3_HAELA|nr:hypothetical protein HaLaN_08311 [Haematococcus lacustris]